MKVRVNGSLKEYYTVWMEGDVVCMIDQAMLPFEFSVYRVRGPTTKFLIQRMLYTPLYTCLI